MAAASGRFKLLEHSYCLKETPEKKHERIASFFSSDHSYAPVTANTPEKKRKRDFSSPTGKTPTQPLKAKLVKEDKARRNLGWTSEEKAFLIKHVEETPRDPRTSLVEYWNEIAEKINAAFPDSSRNGNSCKSVAQRLLIAPNICTTSPLENATNLNNLTADVATQTDFIAGPDQTEDDRIFLAPKRELQEGASRSAELIHQTALKRLRQYAPLSRTEKACLIDLIYNATPQQMARTMMGITSLGEELRNIVLFDLEMEAQECANKGSALYLKHFDNLIKFRWENIINEMVKKQSFLAQVLLTITLPRNKIGDSKRTQDLVPVLGTAYAILMKQRYSALSGVQKMISVALANEQTHQKISLFTVCERWIESSSGIQYGL
ncbi:uncharacterized protein LOC127880853 isoform X2 [Dreissena polymorpha]|nr:uncharacterized protein LOC127880853 isoform X2 [Dreissena polymorpha]